MAITGVGTNNGQMGDVYQQTGGYGKGNGAGFSAIFTDLTKDELTQMISEQKEELYKKLKNNDTEPRFQIGGQSLTIKEWNKLLKQFDEVQEEIKEAMQEEQAKRQKEVTTKVTKKAETSVTSKDSTDVTKAAGAFGLESEESINGEEENVMDSLVSESTTCTYPADPSKWYITCYTKDGISCKGPDGYYWSISFENEGDYNKVMAFLDRFAHDANLTFASQKSFWQDFLSGKIDEDAFVEDFKNQQ